MHMTSQKIAAADVVIPQPGFDDGPGEVFKLSSHERAREALKLALSISRSNFNVFVLGEDRCGRNVYDVELSSLSAGVCRSVAQRLALSCKFLGAT